MCAWRTAKTNDHSSLLHLPYTINYIESNFSRLLCLRSDCIESYLTSDANGLTLRRVALLNEQQTIDIDASNPLERIENSQIPQNTPPPSTSSVAIEARTTRASAVDYPTSTKSRIEAELRSIQMRYPSAAAAVSPLANDATLASDMQRLKLHGQFSFTACVSPTDPMWISLKYSKQRTRINVVCTIIDPGMYPKKDSFTASLDPGCSFLSSQERIAFDKLLAMECAAASGQRMALSNVLRQIENRGGELFYQSVDIALEVAQRRRQQAHAEYHHDADEIEESESTEQGSETSYEHEHEECSSDGEGNHDMDTKHSSRTQHDTGSPLGALSAADSPSRNRPSTSSNVSVLRSTLHLHDLQLSYIDTLDAVQLHVQVVCARCASAAEAIFDFGSNPSRMIQLSRQCPICHIDWHLTATAKIVHGSSNALASFRSSMCVPVDILPSSVVAAQCSGCSKLAGMRHVRVGYWNERQCGTCHSKMAFHAQQAVFSPVSSSALSSSSHAVDALLASSSSARAGSSSSKHHSDVQQQNLLIVPGHELPFRGTCRHYRHSYRWLRFPCCGMRYPCDLCHEEASDHEMKWATRMTCGFCSVELAVADQCASCGKKVAATASRPAMKNTQFWEGGQGQRDVSRLSKNDPRKRRGRYKTKSRKDERVGVTGKERRTKAKEEGD